MNSLFGSLPRAARTSEVFPYRRSESTKSFSVFFIARSISISSFRRLQKASPLTTPPYSNGFFHITQSALRTLRNASGDFRYLVNRARWLAIRPARLPLLLFCFSCTIGSSQGNCVICIVSVKCISPERGIRSSGSITLA